MERLVEYDPKKVLERTKELLRDRGILPLDCPLESCLVVHDIILDNTLGGEEITVVLDARPPKLPPTYYGQEYDIHPVCSKCGIQGTSSRNFVVIQDANTGRIKVAKAEWENWKI